MGQTLHQISVSPVTFTLAAFFLCVCVCGYALPPTPLLHQPHPLLGLPSHSKVKFSTLFLNVSCLRRSISPVSLTFRLPFGLSKEGRQASKEASRRTERSREASYQVQANNTVDSCHQRAPLVNPLPTLSQRGEEEEKEER